MSRILFVLVGTAIMLFPGVAWADPIGFSVDDFDDNLYRLDLFSGGITALGPTGFRDVEGLTFDSTTGKLFGVDESSGSLLTLDMTTGAGTAVAGGGTLAPFDSGLAASPTGRLIMSNDVNDPMTGNSIATDFFEVDKVTGIATFLSQSSVPSLDGLAYHAASGVLYGASGVTDAVYRVNPDTGSTLMLFDLTDPAINIDLTEEVGVGSEGDSIFILDDLGENIEIDVITGDVFFLPLFPIGAQFEGLAVVPEPTTVMGLASLAGFGLVLRWRRRRAKK